MPVPAGLENDIVSMITARLKDKMVEFLQTPYPDSDISKVNRIGIGRLQENTLATGRSMMIRPTTEMQAHELSDTGYVETPIAMIGNGKLNVFYIRPFIIELSFFYKASEDVGDGDFQSTAQISNVIIKRLHHMIHTTDWISNMKDDFGEAVWHAPIVRQNFAEEGGTKKGTTNYRGDMTVDFFTQYIPITQP